MTPVRTTSALQTRRRQGFPELRLHVGDGGPPKGLVSRQEEQTPATASSIALDGPPGYDIGSKLGAGSVSVVYMAKRQKDGQSVALKCVRNPEEEVQRVTEAEYELLQSLNHSGITLVYDLIATPNEIWISMELCPGGSLDSHVAENGVISLSRARSYSRQLLEVVNYLHAKRIVHRDLKPQNILLKSGRKHLKVTDFNSARRIGGTSGSMLSFRGTPCFSPPEVRFEQNWNERVDIWAFGLTMFFVLHARMPFDIMSPEVIEAFRLGRQPEVTWSEKVDEPFRNFISQALAVQMEERPPAMELLYHPALLVKEIRSSSAPCSSRHAAPEGRQLYSPESPYRARKAHPWERLAQAKSRQTRQSGHRRFSVDYESPTLTPDVWSGLRDPPTWHYSRMSSKVRRQANSDVL